MRIELERGCLRLTPDEWIDRLLGRDVSVETLDAMRDPMEALLWGVAEKVLKMGGEVILDFGFWSRAERDDFRARAAGVGAQGVIHFPIVSEAELFRRLRERNARLPDGCFRLDEERVKGWVGLFEPPDREELGLDGGGAG